MKLHPVLPTLRMGTVAAKATPQAQLPFPLNLTNGRTQLWYLGRNAIYAALGILDLKEGDTVLVPSYTNGVEVAAIVARGLKVHQVRIKPDFTMDLDDLDRAFVETKSKLVLAIHYLGFAQPIDGVMTIARKHGARVFEDCALSFLAKQPDGRPVGSVGDLAIYSVYKTLPVPDGAILVVNDPTLKMPTAPVEPDAASSVSGVGRLVMNGARMGGVLGQGAAMALDMARRTAASLMNRAKVERTAAGSMKFETKRLPWGASRFTRSILPRLDYEQIVAQRRANFLHLRKRLASVPTFYKELPEGACPLFYPIIVDDKQKMMDGLNARGIENVNFWSTWDPATPPHEFPEIGYLRQHVVEIPCLQDLDLAAMDRICDAVLAILARKTERVVAEDLVPAVM